MLGHMNLKDYILPCDINRASVSVSGIILGAMLAAADYHVDIWAVIALVLAVLCFQIFTTVIPGIILSVAAVWISYGTVFRLEALIMLLLGYFVYRLVHNHSPHDGLFRNGIVVTLTTLIIYGLLPVYGAYFVCTHSFGNVMLLMPASAIGSLCLAWHNSDNLDDMHTRIFHTFWIVVGFASMMAYSCMRIFDPWHFLFVLTAPVLVYLLYIVWKEGKTPECYPRLLSLMILDFAISTGLGFMAYLFI